MKLQSLSSVSLSRIAGRRRFHFSRIHLDFARSMALAKSLEDGTANISEMNSDYTKWSNADLIQRVTNLEAQLRKQCNRASDNLASNATSTLPRKSAKKPAKPFDPSKYSTRHIALKFAYLGARYNGFEYHANNITPLPTVEEELWKALRKTRLIFPEFRAGQSHDDVCWDGCDYSKCGRTDRGVSAFGQVIALKVRSNRPRDTASVNDLNGEIIHSGTKAEATGTDSICDREQSQQPVQPASEIAWDSIRDEIPYLQLLNRVLPPDIRVLAWCHNPPPNFSARFNCKERRYRYFFTNPAYIPNPGSSATDLGSAWLDIPQMQEAAKKFEGLHDFRNFCKVDGSKQITNFERRIFHASIHRVESKLESGAFFMKHPFDSTLPTEMYCFEVRGSAFLWHQVRHMVAILFLIGQRYESPGLIDRLFGIEDCPAKPMYEMADDVPLVLWDCIFPDLEENILVDHKETFASKDGYVDGLDWIYIGDNEVVSADGKRSTVSEAMQDRKFGPLSIMENLWTQWQRRKIDETLTGSLMEIVAQQGNNSKSNMGVDRHHLAETSARVFDGSGIPRTVGRYIPLMQRQRMETPEVLNARYASRKGLNGICNFQSSPNLNQ